MDHSYMKSSLVGWEHFCLPTINGTELGFSQLHVDRDACKWSEHTPPKEAPLQSAAPLRLGNWLLQNPPGSEN